MQTYSRDPLSRRKSVSSYMHNGLQPNVSDSGLGIMTDAHIYGSIHPSPCTNQEAYATYDTYGQNDSVVAHRKLLSPFEENVFTTAPQWTPGYTYESQSEGALSALGATPNQPFFSPQNIYGDTRCFSSVALDSGLPPYSSFPYETSRTPISHCVGGSTPASQFPSSLFATPDRSNQWTPRRETLEWQNVPQRPSSTFQYPATMANQREYQTSPQSQYMLYPYHPQGMAMTVPLRRKPHLRPSLSESCVPRTSSSAHVRASSMGYFLHTPPYEQFKPNITQEQLPLPPLPPNASFDTSRISSPLIVLPGSPAPTHRTSRSCPSTSHRRKYPQSPPASDFAQNGVPYLVPVKQEPAFQGDIYTPKYKRRTANGRWEGWCGYCGPGRWLDLKNSRYWEDKLRNHGICAKTKMKFAEPLDIRWVHLSGALVSEAGSSPEQSHPGSDQRRREGFCGVCKAWIPMDGLRTKARDRAVGWWMHAYKCHDHSKPPEVQDDTRNV